MAENRTFLNGIDRGGAFIVVDRRGVEPLTFLVATRRWNHSRPTMFAMVAWFKE